MNNTDMNNTDMNNTQADAEAEYQRLCAEARASGPDCRDDFDPMEAFPVLRAWARARSPHMINTFDEIERGFREIAAMDARHAELHAETLAAGKSPFTPWSESPTSTAIPWDKNWSASSGPKRRPTCAWPSATATSARKNTASTWSTCRCRLRPHPKRHRSGQARGLQRQ